MNTTTLSPDTLAVLLGFLDTRFDALCEHLAEDRDPRGGDVTDEARTLTDEVRRAVRWAEVPAHLAMQVTRAIKDGRALWERGGCGTDEVRRHLARALPAGLVGFALQETYRDAPDEALEVPAFEAVEVVEPADDDGPAMRVRFPRPAGGVANPPRVPGHQPVA